MPPPRKRASKKRQEDTSPVYFGMTANQVVAHNLTQARLWKRMTQQQAADELEPYLGSRWSKATFSAAERSVTGERVRNFDADEIVAFAQAFNLPVAYFFLPPMPVTDQGLPVMLETAGPPALKQHIARLFDLVFGKPEDEGLMSLRMKSFLQHVPRSSSLFSDAQARITTLVQERIVNLVDHALGDIAQWQRELRGLAQDLEILENQARHEALDDPKIAGSAEDPPSKE